LLGWIDPGEPAVLLGQLGIAFLLGMAGLHLKPEQLAAAGWSGLWVATLGMAFSLAGGYILASWWGSPHPEALYIGTTLTATSIGISVQLLLQFGLINHRIGRTVIAAAVIDDVLALYLLSVAHGMLSDELRTSQVFLSMVLAAISFISIFMVGRWLGKFLLGGLLNLRPVLRLGTAGIFILAFGWLTEAMGYSLVVGAFFAGLGMGNGMHHAQRTQLRKSLAPLVVILVPFFFFVIGSRAEWQVLADPGMPTLLTGLLGIALLGKTLGGIIGAGIQTSFGERLVIGLSMVPRGEVALIITGLGFMQNHIGHHVMVALLLTTIGAALLGPLLTSILARRFLGDFGPTKPL
jgi:Kef-type K+ transport system membrane component KefB